MTDAVPALGLKPEQVKIHTLLAGGSFGRRANMGSDYIVEAVSVAKALGAPFDARFGNTRVPREHRRSHDDWS